MTDALLVVSAIVATAAMWVPTRWRSELTSACVVVAVGATGAGLARDGARWQPAVVLLGLAAAVVGARVSVRLAWRAVASVAAGGVALGGLASAMAFAELRLPSPTGPAAVGTAVVQWTDADRLEPATDAPDDHRIVVAQLWYPAVPGTGIRRAAYLGRDAREVGVVAAGIADTLAVPSILLQEARLAQTSSRWDAQPAGGRERWPVVLFSPGLSGVRMQSTAWAEEVASHGYVVVALDHPHDSAVVVLEDGTTVRSSIRSTGDDEEDDRLAAGWTAVRAGDLRFVRAHLADGGGPMPTALAGRIDAERVAVAGHSLGGAAAIQAATEDPTFRAVIDLDGFPRNIGRESLRSPLLVVAAGMGSGNPANDREYARERRRVLDADRSVGYELTVPGAAHLTFTDAPLLLPPVPSLVGSGSRRHGPALTARVTLAFLRATMHGGEAGALEAALRRDGNLRVWPVVQ